MVLAQKQTYGSVGKKTAQKKAHTPILFDKKARIYSKEKTISLASGVGKVGSVSVQSLSHV